MSSSTMKAKLAYILLICGIVALLAVGAVWTRTLFDLSISGTEIARVQEPRVPTPASVKNIPVSETIIEVGSSEPAAQQTTSAPGQGIQPTGPATPARTPPPDKAVDKGSQTPTRAPAPQITRTSEPPAAAAAGDSAEGIGIGQVVGIRGTVLATDAKGRRRVLALESWIFANDRIDTDKDARLNIKFKDGSAVSQGESTTIVMDEYVYDPTRCEKSCLAVRFIRGVCRVITGVIAEINPERFEVKTRMATVGIRGCDLAFRSSTERDDIYVIDLAGKKLVRVNTTVDGSRLVNVMTGDALEVDGAKRTVIDITEPNSAIFITRGKGFSRKSITLDDVRQIAVDTALMPPARPELLQSPDGAVFKLQPEKPAPPQAPDQPK